MRKNHSLQVDNTEVIMGNLLKLGVVSAAVIAIIGGIIFLFRHGMEQPNYHTFHGVPADLETINGVIGLTKTLHGRGIIQLGLLLLIFTPIARVIFSVLAFAKKKDYLYVFINLIVLLFLIFSLSSGTKL